MPISADDVRWVYNLIFLRDPETESIVEHWAKACNSTRELIEIVERSDEALSLRDAALQRRGLFDLSDEGLLRILTLRRTENYDLSGSVQQNLLPILRRLAPHSTSEFRKVRIGRDHDGGYVMLDKFQGTQAAYSLGISDDVSWDVGIAQRGIPVFQYDHTIDSPPESHALFHWFKIGIEGVETSDRSLDTLVNIVHANGHGTSSDLILKCDIEGHEWNMLANLPNNLLGVFSQIAIELHFTGNFFDQKYLETLRSAVDQLTRLHKVVHVHANNCLPYLIMGGIPLPAALELTLVREDAVQLQPSHESFPTPLDMPNSPKVIDYNLGAFRF